MGNKLEQLLNSLIKRGWKPFGRETRHELSSGVVYDTIDFKGKRDIRVIDRRHHHIRELVAKESGLWQFVCDNGMIKSNGYCNGWAYHDSYDEYDEGDGMYDEGELPRYYDADYQYRVIESSLKDESELESFILDNIKL